MIEAVTEDRHMPKASQPGEEGISLLFAMFTLLLVTAIAMGMMFMSSTETGDQCQLQVGGDCLFRGTCRPGGDARPHVAGQSEHASGEFTDSAARRGKWSALPGAAGRYTGEHHYVPVEYESFGR
jgi:hypothetical protein